MTTTESVQEPDLSSSSDKKREMTIENGNERQICQRSCSLRRNDDGEGFFYRWMPRWSPTSAKLLEKAEEKILGCLTVPYKSFFADIDGGVNKIRTLKMNPSNSTKTPYVLIHGFASGVALWVMNLEGLAVNRPVYAIDVMGFGRSSRPKFPFGAEAAEAEFVRSIEEWRKSVGLEKMILIGHSLGGFLSSAYSLAHPERVKHLVLLDPWGVVKRDEEEKLELPYWARIVGTIALSFNPLSTIRAAGPLGPYLIRKARGETVGRKFSSLFSDDRISQYIYHCNAQYPAGEQAFKDISMQVGWARNPLEDRIGELPAHIPISMIYGSRSWMDFTGGSLVKQLRPNSRVDVRIIKGADHHVYADKSGQLNELINSLCKDSS
ncbi:1-acylglycerol-3-phosphate O-acyltransferase ABHD5-like [Lytechinus pictus]|uniref:1-acylglycerol-3-phosphate O-acyltransferase ABHD5-like n=1 Tax=Lytechinus pictus TaxID=7653 RepID=UPI0030B9FF4A